MARVDEAYDPEVLAREALAGKRVLIVEDNGLPCFVLEETLRGVGGEVIGPIERLAAAMREASRSAAIPAISGAIA